MKAVNTIIKWPGGKTREIKYIENLIPSFDRYIEPFFGGGAMFFYLRPQSAIINDISYDLTKFYSLVKEQNQRFYGFLCAYDQLMKAMLASCEKNYQEIYSIYSYIKNKSGCKDIAVERISKVIALVLDELPKDCISDLVLSFEDFAKQLEFNVLDKMNRTVKNAEKLPFNDSDLMENLITGFTSGMYMYFREVYNDILLKRKPTPNIEYDIANFYFIREYCYGSMFRYNKNGEFNIPYGGMSYNRKSFRAKIDNIFSENTKAAFEKTDIYCKDFEDLLSTIDLGEKDFLFLDPPYDTDFSDYEGKAFTKEDQKRLSMSLKNTKAKFILIIKNTDYIYSLYQDSFSILCFDKTYTYNVRSRNERNVEHLIITNLPV